MNIPCRRRAIVAARAEAERAPEVVVSTPPAPPVKQKRKKLSLPK